MNIRGLAKKGGFEGPPSLTFANLPQKHAYINGDRGCKLLFIVYKIDNYTYVT